MDALILAGGENRRMPVTKGFLEINNNKIIESNLELLRNIFKRVLISTNNPELYFYLGVPMVGDVVAYRGPMTGIFSALAMPEVSDVFVTACDMPFINGILINYIVAKWSDMWDAVIPIFNNTPQPMLGIYSKRIVESMEESLKTGKKSLRDFLHEINVRYIQEDEVRNIDREGKSFVNINTMEDLQREGGKICLA